MKAIEKLLRAIQERDADSVESILYEHPIGDAAYIDLLIELLPQEWHYKHEDIARYLQQLKSSKAVDALFTVTTKKFEYLEYDNSLSFARKCTWALADIGTDSAKASLESLARCGEVEVELLAQKRLVSWNK